MVNIVESLYRISGAKLVEAKYNENNLLYFDDQLNFINAYANHFKKRFGKTFNKNLIYFDDVDGVDDRTSRDIPGLKCDGSLSYSSAYEILDQYLIDTGYITIKKEFDSSKPYADIANKLGMEDEDVFIWPWHSLYSKEKMSYGNNFKYKDLFSSSPKMAKLIRDSIKYYNARVDSIENKVTYNIYEPIPSKVWQCNLYPGLYLINYSGFNFLTTEDMLSSDIDSLNSKDIDVSSLPDRIYSTYDCNGELIYTANTRENLKKFCDSHVTAYKTSSNNYDSYYVDDYYKLNYRIYYDYLLVRSNLYGKRLLSLVSKIEENKLSDKFELTPNGDWYKIPEDNKYYKPIYDKIMGIIEKEKKDYNV